MKFILQEDKFILNENRRFFLNERFILNEAETLEEASVGEVAQKWAAQLTDTFSNTEVVLKKYKEFAGNSETNASVKGLKSQFDRTSANLSASLELPASEITEELTTIKAELRSYIQILTQILGKIKSSDANEDTLTLLETRIKKLTAIHGKAEWKAEDLAQLAAIIKWAEEQLTPVFKEASGTPEEALEKFRADCDECLRLLAEIKENLPTDFSKLTADELRTFKEVAQKAIEAAKLKEAEKITRIAVVQGFKTVQPQVQALKAAYTQLSKLPLITQQINNKAKADAERTFGGEGEVDWKLKYAKAVNKSAVIEEFIYTTWDDFNKASKVLQVKEAVAQECESFGFKPSDAKGENGNPFIWFISNVYLKYNMRPDAYNVIHNLVANGVIKTNDLVGAEDSSLARGNIIFCKDLYAQEVPVIKLYVKKQNSLLKATTKPDTFKSIPEMVYNMLYKLPEITTGSQIKTAWSTGLKLNTLTVIENLESKWVGKVSQTQLDPNDKPEKSKTATNAELINQIKTPEDAVKVLVTLAAKFSSNDDLITVVESCTEAKQLMAKSTTFTEIQKLVASVERLYKLTNITATQALSLAKSILETEAFGLTKE